ncbi:type III pantothenate kinase [Algibacter mikhailovii]|uniref:Type III pantothenate kinase n=1 Tax=Algibacter mikhailovii TaxID=425498 RepID=A0A918R2X5_9FLAO|nr:type III pantothenate kinase [Algibacter mikhailovii]GGZ83642.1 type III pantothenate kinase [Algibacter mikhailovii]
MNLIIDVGNSFVKLAIFHKGVIKYKVTVELELVLKQLEVLSQAYGAIKGVIISSVGGLTKSDLEAINKRYKVLLLDYQTKLPFKNCYKTPKTLGVDRLALVSAATKQYPSCNVLIIDAGTCITYDFKSDDNSYLGGAISPGINMRYKSLHNLTANLPLLKASTPKYITGGSTEESIHSGVIHGVLSEIDGAIELYKLKYSDLTVILTGGDAKFLSKQLKSSIFANSNFLLEGLDYLLQINSNE